jgi:enoyl-CoA hydratase/carnithine racemase
MFLTAEMVPADEAMRIGLVDVVCEDPMRKAVERVGLKR